MQTIPPLQLAAAAIPALVVMLILFSWRANAVHDLIALARMVGQLLLVGYVLVYIFDADTPWVVLGVAVVMVTSASWIALRTIPKRRRSLYRYALTSIAIGGGLTLTLITQVVLDPDPWFEARVVVPLAGMTFAASMNAVSIAAERVFAELDRGVPYTEARRIAMQAGLIPIVNALLAVGLVSLPGFMTGQILSGVSPLVAVRYQVMVMCMIFGASGTSAALFLTLLRGPISSQTAATNPSAGAPDSNAAPAR